MYQLKKKTVVIKHQWDMMQEFVVQSSETNLKIIFVLFKNKMAGLILPYAVRLTAKN